MLQVLRADVNVIVMILLGIITVLAGAKLDKKDAFNQLFFIGCIVIIAMLIFESITCFINGHPSAILHWLTNALHVFLFSTPPLLSYYWLLLVKALTELAPIHRLKPVLWQMIPVFINALIVLVSPYFHWSFYIDTANTYNRGPLFFVTIVVSYGYLIAGFFLLLKRRAKLIRQEFAILAIFCLLPMIGGIIQSIFYGPLLMWASIACSLIVLYLYLQERMVQTDSLTGTWTRSSFEYHLAQLLKCDNGEPFGIIFSDIDDFKTVNDRFGHAEGDKAIRVFAEILQNQVRQGDAVARIGGDEFAVLLNVKTRGKLDKVVLRIDNAFERYNAVSGKDYTLSCSIGADMFAKDANLDVEDILRRVDALMYEKKREKKRSAQLLPKQTIHEESAEPANAWLTDV